MTPFDWLLLLAAIPLSTWLIVTLAVYASGLYAWSAGAKEPMDGYQERAFLIARRHGVFSTSAGMAAEGFWQSAAFCLQGLRQVGLFGGAPIDPAGGPPVVLVAGYLENSGQMAPLAARLRRAGYQPVLVDLPSTLHSVRQNAAFVGTVVERVCAESGYTRVGYVGHSMGGVVARAYVHEAETPRLSVVITLGSPHRGTHLAKLGPGASARDMRPGSEHMRSMPATKMGPVPIHSLIAPRDNIVSPAWSCVLAEGENLVIPQPVGHVSLLFLASVAVQVVEWLDAETYPRVAEAEPVHAGADE